MQNRAESHLVQLPLMLILVHGVGGGKAMAALRKEEWKEDMCNITRLAILGLTTGHGYRRLLVTTSYPSTIAAPSPTSWSDYSSVWEAMDVWHDGQH